MPARVMATTTVSNNIVANESAESTVKDKSVRMSMNL